MSVGLAEVKVEVGVLNTSGTKRLLLSNLIVISLLRYPIELFSFSNNNDVISIMMLPFLLWLQRYSTKGIFFGIYYKSFRIIE